MAVHNLVATCLFAATFAAVAIPLQFPKPLLPTQALSLSHGFGSMAFGTNMQMKVFNTNVTKRVPKKPALLLSFVATVQSSGGPAEVIVADKDRLAIAVSDSDVKGRDGTVIDLLSNVQYSRERFFGETVCYTFDLERRSSQVNKSEAIQRATAGFQATLGQVFGVPLAAYDAAQEYAGQKEIYTELGIKGCSVWAAHESTAVPLAGLESMLPQLGIGQEHTPSLRLALQQFQAEVAVNVDEVQANFNSDVSFCVSSSGELLEAGVNATLVLNPPNGSDREPMILFQQNRHTNSTYKTGQKPHGLDFNGARGAVNGHCVDLTQGHVGASELKAPLNRASRLSRINSEAAGHWKAVPYDIWDDQIVEEVIPSLGTEIRPLRLQLQVGQKRQGSLMHGNTFGKIHEAPLPEHFDPRARWPSCPTIGLVRNQGKCGSCWAFAAATVLADRFCIASTHSSKGAAFLQATLNATSFSGDFALAPGHLVDCDGVNHGCQGGRLDDAWWFLRDHGVPLERCRPYRYCPVQSERECKVGPGQATLWASARGDYGTRKCDGECHGTPMRLFRASMAYAVSAPGDIKSLQRELFTHGPVEVAFFVFSDFHNYRRGVYFRTPGAYGPLGGHAVRLLGWGNSSMEYWLAANSWSPHWGLGGNFQIRRGTNECGIESTPAAGQAELWS